MIPDGLSFSVGIAAGWQDADLLDPGARALMGPALADAVHFAATGGTTHEAELLMFRALVAVAPSGSTVGLGLTAMLAAADTPIARTPLTTDLFGADCDVSAVTLPVGPGIRRRRIIPATVELPRTFEIQYLIESGHGLLTVTLTTAQDPDAVEWEELFDAIASTCLLG